MTPSNVAKSILACHKAGLVPMLLGQPGVGKSSIVADAAKELGVPIVDFRPALHGIEDLIGLPTFSDDKKFSSFATPSWLPRTGKGIFFIDEMPQALPGMMAALSQFIYDRKLGDYELPEGWDIVIAGNRLTDRAATHKMPSHINDRVTFIDVEFSGNDFDDWCHLHKIHTAVRAFVKFNPKIVTSFDPQLEINCTPRSLVMASKLIGVNNDIEGELMEGTIGPGPAAEFRGYLKIWEELPDIEDLLKNPTRIAISEKPDIIFGVSTMLSANATLKTFKAMVTYMSRVPPEYTASFVKDAIRLNKDLIETDTFAKYLKENANVLV